MKRYLFLGGPADGEMIVTDGSPNWAVDALESQPLDPLTVVESTAKYLEVERHIYRLDEVFGIYVITGFNREDTIGTLISGYHINKQEQKNDKLYRR